MDMHFIPASPKGDLRLLDEAIGLAIIGHPSVGMVPVDYDNGLTIERLRVGRNLTAIGWPPGMVRARESLHAGLKAAEIQVLVQCRETGKSFQVPRTYWWNHDLTASVLELNPDDQAQMPQLNGQPLIVDASQQQAWLQAAYPERQKSEASNSTKETRGTLPARATPGDRRAENAAHATAAKVREGMSIQRAATAVIDMVDADRSDEARIRGIRQAYNLMYDLHGQPIKN